MLGLCGLALCAWCGFVSGFHRSTTPARVTWAVSLVAVVLIDLLLGLRARRGWGGGAPPPRTDRGSIAEGRPKGGELRRTGPWLALALVVVAWEALGIDTGPHQAHLTISSLTEAYRPLNAATLLVWILVGVFYGVVRAKVKRSATAVSKGPGAPVAAVGLHAGAPGLLLPGSRAAGVAFWACVLAAAGLVELVARRSSGRLATGEELLRLITTPVAVRAVVVVAWAYAGYHLFAH